MQATSLKDIYYQLVKNGEKDIDQVPERDNMRDEIRAKIEADSNPTPAE